MAIDAASIPKDAKIAVLEKSSTESEKKIAGKSYFSIHANGIFQGVIRLYWNGLSVFGMDTDLGLF